VDVDPEVDGSSVDVDDNVEGTASTGRGGRGAFEYIGLRSASVEWFNGDRSALSWAIVMVGIDDRSPAGESD
jgi:hypothetical protein